MSDSPVNALRNCAWRLAPWLCGLPLLTGDVRGADELTPAALLQEVQRHHPEIHTLHKVVFVEIQDEGRPPRWTRETIDQDEFERVRLFAEAGEFDDQHAPVVREKSLAVFNGDYEVDVDYDYAPNEIELREIERRAQAAAATITLTPAYDQKPYTQAIVYPRRVKTWPIGQLPWSGSPTFWLMSELETHIQNGSPIRISRVAGTDRYDVRFDARSPNGKMLKDLSQYVIDPAAGWNAVAEVATNGAGTVFDTRENTFEEVLPQVWLLTRVVSRNPTARSDELPTQGPAPARRVEIPRSVRRTQITDYRINDPAFSDDLFQVELKPGTFVSDHRFSGFYRIGDEAKTDADLRDLADRARGENVAANLEQTRDMPAPPQRTAPASSPPARENAAPGATPAPAPPPAPVMPVQPEVTAANRHAWLIGVNVALLGVLAGWAAWRVRTRKSKAGQ